ncbi:HlyD family type I secretion periplasmic adaptor subunit [Chrysiogenes arsenatis]|uniref:HlyD family type I secretion periplasmic adaptor subunit n=1 Tax=Chrysiogenes arsenatis TaxID=309797 RepID=UPI00135F194F|nr:HlyD family type I secretion periplasmic adaptor subunit [Chrysiogenes arsenatis]
MLDNYVVLALTDTQGIIKHVSTNLCNLFGYRHSDLIDRSYDFLIDKGAMGKFKEQFRDAGITKSIWKGEIKHSSKHDIIIWTDTIIQPLFNDQREHIGFVLASNDITQAKKLKKIHEDNMISKKYDKNVLAFMPSFSSAVLLRSASGLQKVLWLWAFIVIFALVWASISKIDEMVKSGGKIITSDNIATVSTLDAGIIEEVLVKEGDTVVISQPIIKLHDLTHTTEYDKNWLRLLELRAKQARLKAEAAGVPMVNDPMVVESRPSTMEYEASLYRTNQQKLAATQAVLNERLQQRKNDLQDALSRQRSLRENYTLLSKEMEIKQQLVKDGIISRVAFMQEVRRYNDLEAEMNAIDGSLPTIQSSIRELEKGMRESQLSFIKDAEQELTSVNGEIERLNEILIALKDKVRRTMVLSPVDGVVKTIAVKTHGAAVQAGRTLMEIVPQTDYFVAELKIKPSDIGFIYPGQMAKLKINAFDFVIYGGIEGAVSYISPDTIKDDNGRDEWYMVHVRAQNDHVGTKTELRVKPGMTVEAGIITGQKTIMDYILKPILKTKQSALTER